MAEKGTSRCGGLSGGQLTLADVHSVSLRAGRGKVCIRRPNCGTDCRQLCGLAWSGMEAMGNRAEGGGAGALARELEP